jgi:aromatic-L-amino-acid decarboxylase
MDGVLGPIARRATRRPGGSAGSRLQAANAGIETAGPRVLAAVPGGVYVSALAEFITRTINRFAGLSAAAPALTAMEESVLRWMAHDVCGLPEGSALDF